MTFWAVEWHDNSELDGPRKYLVWGRDVRLYRTRRECRAFIEQEYGYIRHRPDLRAQPFGLFLPRAVRVVVRTAKEESAGS